MLLLVESRPRKAALSSKAEELRTSYTFVTLYNCHIRYLFIDRSSRENAPERRRVGLGLTDVDPHILFEAFLSS